MILNLYNLLRPVLKKYLHIFYNVYNVRLNGQMILNDAGKMINDIWNYIPNNFKTSN